MTSGKFIGLILVFLFAVSALSGCGHGGAANSGMTIDLKAAKGVALADGNDVATVQANVENADGTPAPDGTSVSFTAAESSGPLPSSTATTANGKASFSLVHAPISGATHVTVTITASAGGASASQDVKFITQPSSVDVFIAFNQAVTNLAGLQFNLISTPGATFDNNAQRIFPMNNAVAGSSSQVVGNFDPAANSTKIILSYAGFGGFNTGTTPIIKATFAITAGLPVFSIDELTSAATFTAVGSVGTDFGATTPPVTAENLVVTTTYDTEN
jgi:Big-like domain-containing protein